MAIEKTYLLGKNITLGCGFDLQAKAPLDSRQIVPEYAGLQALIDGNAAYEGMIVYDEETKKTYQAQLVDGALAFREFGINEAELKDLIASETTAAMEFKGVATALPSSGAKGDVYKVSTGFTVEAANDAQAAGFDAKIGDSIVCDGEGKWFLIPSGDDIEDTWRPVTDVANDATLTFAAGDKLDVAVASNGTITYSHEAIDAPTATPVGEDEQTRTYITAVETDGHGHITGYKTATENVEDTNTEYTFEGQSDETTSVYFQVTSNEEGATAEVIYLDAYSKNEADGKFVAKETGKSLVSDDEITRLASVDNYDDEEVRGLIGDNTQAIEDLEAYVGTIPTDEKYADITNVISYVNKKAEETLAAAQGGSSETAASVKQQLDNYKSENDTRVKAVEDDIDAINNADTGILKQAQNYADSLAGNYDEAGAAAGVQTALEAEIAKKVDAEAYATDKATFATKTELGDVDKKFENYRTSANQDVIDNDHKERIEALEAKFTGDDSVDAKIAAAVDAEKQRAEGIEGGLRTDVNAVAGRVSTAEGKITELETESAKHALKTEVEAVDAKFADYTKAADLPTDLGDFTNDAGYAKTADVNTELDKKADKTQVATDIANAIAPLATTEALNGVKATAEAATTVEEVDAQIDAKITALNLGTTYEPVGAEDRAKAYVDQKFTDADLAQYTTEAEVKSIVDGVIAGAADSETYNSLSKLVDYIDTHGGEATEMAQAIETLEGDVKGLKEAPAAGIKASDIEAWNGEIGAKAIAESKTTTAEVKTQIEAYGYATTEYADTAASNAQTAAEATAAGALATARTEITAEIDADVKALADGQVKTNTEAIATKANAADVYAKTETFTKEEVAAAIAAAVEAAHTWGTF